MAKTGKKYKQPSPFTKPPPDANRAPLRNPTDKSDLSSEPIPKAFKRILAKSARIAKRATEPKARKTAATYAPQKGESLRAFNRRVDDAIRVSVNNAAKAETATAAKRKARLKERKLRREGKSKGAKNNGSDDEKQFPIKEDVPFGVQANEPPRFTVVPKKVGGGAGAMRAMQAAIEAKEKKEKEEEKKSRAERREDEDRKKDAELPSVGRKIKFKDLPLVRQKNLMEERQRVIEQYRKAKAEANK
ncbi:hypothetical protein BC830DRAFT_1099350 [Chytriomyces sp. MP71]|nr:hypothetical protein BC830DRAFT_1099350 [Chytriomyces sp. MP71]